MSAYPPFKIGDVLGTKLSPLDEMAFKTWADQNRVPFDVNSQAPSDYDMRGYYRGVMQGSPMARPTEINVNDGRPHYTDYYKTPMHETFSNGSQWADESTPRWINDHQLASPEGQIKFDEAQPRAPADSLQSIVDLLAGKR